MGAFPLLLNGQKKKNRASETNKVLEEIGDNQEAVIIETKNNIGELTSALKGLDTNNKNSQDKISEGVDDLEKPLKTIADNLVDHHHHHSHSHSHNPGDGFFRDSSHSNHHHDDHEHIHGEAVYTYTPKVTIIANRTTNLKPVQFGNTQNAGSALSNSASSDENNPTEGVSDCSSDFLGAIFCNPSLTLGGKKRSIQKSSIGKSINPLEEMTKEEVVLFKNGSKIKNKTLNEKFGKNEINKNGKGRKAGPMVIKIQDM